MAARDVGRPPEEIDRSACVLVRLEPGSEERPHAPAAPAVRGGSERIAAALREFSQAGADEVILVADPITERSVCSLAEAVAAI